MDVRSKTKNGNNEEREKMIVKSYYLLGYRSGGRHSSKGKKSEIGERSKSGWRAYHRVSEIHRVE